VVNLTGWLGILTEKEVILIEQPAAKKRLTLWPNDHRVPRILEGLRPRNP
jgi:hypothetical protein